MYSQQPDYAGNNPYVIPQGVDPYKDKAIMGFVLGIIAIIVGLSGLLYLFGSFIFTPFLLAPPISITCSIVGIVFSVQARRRSFTQKTRATIGLVLSTIALVIAVVMLILIVISMLTLPAGD